MAAGWLSQVFHGHEWQVAVLLAGSSGLGLLCSMAIGKVPAAAPQIRFRANFVARLWGQIQLMRRDRTLWLSVICDTYFWVLGTLFFQTVVVCGKKTLQLEPCSIALLDAALALGIGIGSLLAGYLSGNKIEYGVMPLGAFGMTIMAAVTGAAPHTFLSAALALAGLGIFGGFFAVPVNALIQHRPAADKKGGIIAAANLLSFVAGVAASGAYFLFTRFGHLDPRGVFVAGAGDNLARPLVFLFFFSRLLLALPLLFFYPPPLPHTI